MSAGASRSPPLSHAPPTYRKHLDSANRYIDARIARHLRPKVALRRHIDYLLEVPHSPPLEEWEVNTIVVGDVGANDLYAFNLHVQRQPPRYRASGWEQVV